MVGILGLLTGWVLLMPAFVVLFVSLGGPYHPLMAPFLGVGASLPMLVFMSAAGAATMFFSLRRLSRRDD